MPNLTRFAGQGTRFVRHHAVFPSVTRLNVASLVTGCYPATHGIAGNRFVMRDVDPHRPIDVLEPAMRRLQEVKGVRALLVPTLGDILDRHGMEYVAVVSGTTGNAFCQHPNAGAAGGAVIHPDFCAPRDLAARLEDQYGAWPAETIPNAGRLRHATDLLLGYAIDERQAAVSMVWYSEPDKTQHQAGVGSRLAEQALSAADLEFGRLIAGLAALPGADDTDVIVVSDHGYSTSLGPVDVADGVRGAGFPNAPQPGGVAVATNGGAVLFYVAEADRGVAARLAAWLLQQPWCGAVFAAERVGEIGGTLPASLIGIDGPRGPDLAASMAWDAATGPHGASGRAHSAGGAMPGTGDHGSASRFEMRNTLVARGPSFRERHVSDIASGIVDVAPTILQILRITESGLDGRTLHEALTSASGPAIESTVRTVRARVRKGSTTRTLAATVSATNGVAYLDEAGDPPD
jgi:arylsulfatase A-like enzyme